MLTEIKLLVSDPIKQTNYLSAVFKSLETRGLT